MKPGERSIDRDVENVTRQIVRLMNPERIILFESAASGAATKTSDLDLLIIRDTRKPFKRRMNELYPGVDSKRPVDMFCHKPVEFERMRNESSFVRHAHLNGKTVHEKRSENGSRPLAQTGPRRCPSTFSFPG
jgi:predicted nucleotidyltransferase